jgi:hypothetical protein
MLLSSFWTTCSLTWCSTIVFSVLNWRSVNFVSEKRWMPDFTRTLVPAYPVNVITLAGFV